MKKKKKDANLLRLYQQLSEKSSSAVNRTLATINCKLSLNEKYEIIIFMLQKSKSLCSFCTSMLYKKNKAISK